MPTHPPETPARPNARPHAQPGLSGLTVLAARGWGQARAALQPGEWDSVLTDEASVQVSALHVAHPEGSR